MPETKDITAPVVQGDYELNDFFDEMFEAKDKPRLHYQALYERLASLSVGEYIADPRNVHTTLRTLPIGEGGRQLKRALLNSLETLASELRNSLVG